MEVISNIWVSWPWPLRIIMDLLVLTILLRGIIANRILEELREQGVQVNKYARQAAKFLFVRSERSKELWNQELKTARSN